MDTSYNPSGISHTKTSHGDGDLEFDFHCFGTSDARFSLGSLWKEDNPWLAQYLGNKLEVGISDIYAPDPTQFNALYVSPDELEKGDTIRLLFGTRVYRRSDKPADVTHLQRPGNAYAFSGAGCAMLVVYVPGNPDKLYCAHAGRNSVLDYQRVCSGTLNRHDEGVVETILTQPRGRNLGEVRVWVFASISALDFPHSQTEGKHAEFARALPAYAKQRGWLKSDTGCVLDIAGTTYPDIPRIIRAQCVERGVPAENINIRNGYLADGFPHTRTLGLEHARNLCMVVRRS